MGHTTDLSQSNSNWAKCKQTQIKIVASIDPPCKHNTPQFFRSPVFCFLFCLPAIILGNSLKSKYRNDKKHKNIHETYSYLWLWLLLICLRLGWGHSCIKRKLNLLTCVYIYVLSASNQNLHLLLWKSPGFRLGSVSALSTNWRQERDG